MQKVFFSSDGTNIEYTESGMGERLLLLYDCQGSDEERETLLMMLEKSYNVFCPERRSWLYNGIRRGKYSMELECSELLEFMEEKEIGYLFGHGYGAVVAMHLALRYPLKKMVLFEAYLTCFRNLEWIPKFSRLIEKEDYFGASAVFLKSLGGIKRVIPFSLMKIFLKVLFEITIFPEDEAEQEAVKIICYEDPQEDAMWKKTVYERKRRNYARTVKQIGISVGAALASEPELAELTGIKTKTLIICDCGSEPYVFQSADELAERIPDSRKIVVKLSGGRGEGEEPGKYPDFLKSITVFFNGGESSV